jgi:flagellar motor switch protein FliN/FliY
LPESCGLLPSWYGQPDSGEGRLSAMAIELSGLLLPEETKCESKAARVKSIADMLVRSGVATGAATLELSLTANEKQTSATLVWPASHPELVFNEPPSSDAPTAAAPSDSTTTPVVQDAVTLLPPYSRNLLRIKVPVMVTLASKKQPISKIVEIVPGAIIQFNKSCEEMLEMEVGTYRVALGECVKVGDKFGLRITSLILPAERFAKVQPAKAAG